MEACASLSIAYTPDSDDAFYYDALEQGRVRLRGFRPSFVRAPMMVLNRDALGGVHAVTAISSVVYPAVADRYAILSVGTSVGRGYGPVLVSRSGLVLKDLRGRKVGVGGIPTTGWFLLQTLFPGAIAVEMPFDAIGGAVACGELDAGVMIHEELLYYPKLGLSKVADLGALWCERNGLPLPVGLNLVRRDLGNAAMQRICAAIRRSLRFSLASPESALSRVRLLARDGNSGCTDQFVSMFANRDSLRMPDDVRAALRVLCTQVVDAGIADAVPPFDIVEGHTSPKRSTRMI